MWQILNDTFDTAGFMPHGYCFSWQPTLLWLLVVSDLLIAAAYFSIPFAIFYFAKKRPDIPHRWLFILFGLFIVGCGITHLLDVLTLWQPVYWANALAKAVTALLSLGTAMIIWHIMPSAMQAPSPKQLELARNALQKINAELELRVQERTHDLNTLNEKLQTTLNEKAMLHETIQHEKSLLRSIIDNIPDLIFIKDMHGSYIDCNKAFENYFGSDRYDIIGKTDYDFVDDDTARFFLEKDRDVLNTNQAKRNEEWVTYPNAEKIWLETLKTPFKNHLGITQGIIGISRNITERKLFEQQISTERQRLNNIIDGAHAGTWEWNIQTGECYFNDRWAEIFGYTLAELEPFNFETWSQFVHPDDLKIANQLLEEHLSGKNDYYQCEVRMLHKQGFWIWIADHGRVVSQTAEGKPLMMSGTHLDISKRKHAEEKLRESEERIRLLLDASSFGIWGLDTDGRVTFVNRAATEMLGFTSDELIGQTMHEIVHFRKKDGSVYPIHNCPMTATYLDGHKRKVTDEVFWRKDKTSFPVEYSTHPVYKNDRLVGAVVSFEDITERKQIESRTKQYESIVQSSDDAIISKTMDGIITSWNPGAEAIFGYTAEEMLGHPIKKLFPAERMEEESFIMQKLLTGEKIEHFETERICKDGRLITISATISPLRDTIGQVIGASQIVRNITERKQTEDELRKLWLAVEQSPNSIIITNLDAEIEYVNQRYCETSGYSRAEILGKNPNILKSPKSDSTNYQEMWKTLTTGNRWQGEFYNRRKDGTEYIAYAYITPVRQPDNKITHYLSIQEDITDKKRLEAELDAYRHHLEDLVQERTVELESAKSSAEAANQAKTIFLTNMSHEIRTPMNAILGLTYLLQQDIADPKQNDRLSKVGSSARHLLGIINDILDLSKIEANRLVIEEIPFNVSATLNHVCSMMADRAKDKDISLYKVITPHLKELPLIGDPLRIGQILINFISNALKFTEKDSVTLRADIDRQDSNGLLLRFEVHDTGIGLTEEQQSRIFKAFEQAENSTTREFGGTGLGLTICQKLAHLLGGEVGVSSHLGKGSIFWVTIQVKLGKDLIPELAHDVNSSYQGTRVLLVEDNEINQEVALEMLKSANIEVIVANHGGEAVEKIKEGSFDLIFMDMQMPIMDGIEATRQIRKLPNGSNVPIIAMTANAFSEDRQRCFNVGMNDFIAKPVNPDLLFKSLSLWISAVKANTVQSTHQAYLSENAAALNPPQLLNTAAGLSYFSGKEANYHRMLDRFITLHGQDAAKLRDWINDKHFEDAQRLAHSLKGIADTLGAEQLKKRAESIELYFKNNSDVELSVVSNYIDRLEQQLQAVETAIRELLAQQKSTVPTLNHFDLAKFESVFSQLESLLAGDDLTAESVWREAMPMLSSLIDAETVNTIDRQMRSLDLQGALQSLRKIKRSS